MPATVLTRPTTHPNPTTSATMPKPDPHPYNPTAVNCPICGSSSTYQTSEGRWGCVQCGSSWA